MKSKIVQPLWYHPTTVMLIDDDTHLLDALEINIDKRFFPLCFTSPQKALDHLKKNTLPLEELSRTMMSDIDPSEEKHLSTENLAVDFSPLYSNLDQSVRFKKIISVVVDRSMDEMDGLDFCRTVRNLNLPVNLILLTGHTTSSEAVAALNDNIINAYVEKSPNVADITHQINIYINKLAHQMFCNMSINLLGLLSNRFSFLTDQVYADFLKEICEKYNIVEYIITDSSSSCLLITAESITKMLLIKTAHDFKEAYNIAIDDASAHAEVLADLKNQRAFPFTGINQSYFNSDISQWKKCMTPMKKQKDLNFYYGMVDIPKKVISFKDYANKV